MDYQLEKTVDRVRLESPIRIPFEPKGETAALREELRAALKGLRVPDDDEFLVCTYASEDTGFADLENVLMYNLGASAFRHTTKNGFRLIREFAAGNSEHCYRYELCPRSVWDGSNQSTVATWAFDAGDLSSSTKPSTVWRDCFRGHRTAEASDCSSSLSLSVSISPRTGRSLAPASVVKPLLDGILCAFHQHDGSHSDELRSRIAQQVELAPVTIAQMLAQNPMAALDRRALVRPYRENSIQWNPADDRIVMVDFHVGDPQASCHCAGSIVTPPE